MKTMKTELTKITQEELNVKLKSHRLLLDTGLEEGERLNLSYYDLRELEFSDNYLTFAILNGANLEGAILKNVDLSEAECRDVNFTDADLTKSYLMFTNFSNAIFKNTDLTGAHFRRNNIDKANFNGAILKDTIFFRQRLIDGKYIEKSEMLKVLEVRFGSRSLRHEYYEQLKSLL